MDDKDQKLMQLLEMGNVPNLAEKVDLALWVSECTRAKDGARIDKFLSHLRFHNVSDEYLFALFRSIKYAKRKEKELHVSTFLYFLNEFRSLLIRRMHPNPEDMLKEFYYSAFYGKGFKLFTLQF